MITSIIKVKLRLRRWLMKKMKGFRIFRGIPLLILGVKRRTFALTFISRNDYLLEVIIDQTLRLFRTR
jgi:hypothetical protein